MALYVAGKDTSQTRRRDPEAELLAAIDECEDAWSDDPAYAKARQLLDQLEQELDSLTSPGRRAALRALPANMAGQEPSDRSEPASEAQSARH